MELEKRLVADPITSYGYTTSWASSNLGAGPGAVAFLEVQLAGSKATNVLQLWDNDGTLGMIHYLPTPGGGYELFWSNPNMGQGSGAVAFLTADVNGDGTTEVVQLWDNDGSLGMIVYSPTSAGAYAVSWQNQNMGAGSGAVRFLAADVNGDGKTELLQLWDHDDKLGMIIYSPTINGGFGVSWISGDVGQGSGAVALLTCSVSGGPQTDILQLWDNNDQLAAILYAPVEV